MSAAIPFLFLGLLVSAAGIWTYEAWDKTKKIVGILVLTIFFFGTGCYIKYTHPDKTPTSIHLTSTSIHLASGQSFEETSTSDVTIYVDHGEDKPTTIRLPRNPIDNQTVEINDEDGIAASYPITVLGNGNKINGLDSFVLSVNHYSVPLTYSGRGWVAR